jgi:2-polyprenyl-3-methyl-5-hydroxy-6-metoxy-1,4-benzoquinol methylase
MKGIPKHEWPADLGDEFHDLQELALNTDFETGELKGSWGNLGYWYNEQGDPLHGYSDAAQQLAHALGKFANLSSNQTVLDLGYGCGDQVIHWHQAFSVSCVYGVNLSKIQTEYAQKKMQVWGIAENAHLKQGSAADPQAWYEFPRDFDRIIALDCAYHFSNKLQFFQLCAHQLKDCQHQDAQLVLSDLVLSQPLKGLFNKTVLSLICYLSRIPRQNIKTRAEYERELCDVGLELMDYKDVSERVMIPFADWVFMSKRHVSKMSDTNANLTRLKNLPWSKYVGTALFLRWAMRHDIFQYAFLRIGLKRL